MKFADKLAEIAAEAEAGEADQTYRPIPEHCKVTRPGVARSKVLQVRLNPEEFDAIERLAAERGLPTSTLARAALVEMLRGSVGGRVDAAVRLAVLADEIRLMAVELQAT